MLASVSFKREICTSGYLSADRLKQPGLELAGASSEHTRVPRHTRRPRARRFVVFALRFWRGVATGDGPEQGIGMSFAATPAVAPNPWVRILGALEKKVTRHSFDACLKPTRFSHANGTNALRARTQHRHPARLRSLLRHHPGSDGVARDGVRRRQVRHSRAGSRGRACPRGWRLCSSARARDERSA